MTSLDQKIIATAVLACAAPLFASTAGAQENKPGELEEIVVTAQKREQVLTDVPVSVTAVSAAQLESSGLNSVADLPQMVPGMRVDLSGGFAQPSIRGIGSAIAGTGFSTNVALYVDGFYMPSQLTTDTQFLNLQSVEVLKGPQGTLFGRNATGGAILIKLREPSFDPAMQAKVAYGRFNKREVNLYGSTGVTDTLALDFSGVYEGSDGFTDNLFTGKDGVDGYDNWAVRGAALWKPVDGVSFKLAVQYDDHKDGRPFATNVIVNPLSGDSAAVANVLGAPVPTKRGDVTNSAKTLLKSEATGVYLTSTFDLGGNKLTSFTQYRKETVDNYLDLDSSSLPIQEGAFFDTARTFTQEFNLSGVADKLDYVVGLYYIREREEQDPFPLLVGQLVPAVFPDLTPHNFYAANSDVEAWAAFADVTYQLTDKLSLIGGLRYNKEKADVVYYLRELGLIFQAANPVSLANSGVPFDGKWDGVSPRAGVRYELTDQSNLYFTYSQGFKAGIATPNQLEPNVLKEEKVNAYEVGYKYGGSRTRFDSAVYYYDYKDLQIANYINGSAIYQNADAAEIYGAEAALTTLLTDNLQLNVGAAYTHAEYTDYKDASAFVLTPIGLSTNEFLPDVDGFQMQRAPKWTANVGLLYTIPLSVGSMALSGNYYYTSKFPFDTAGQYFQKAYDLLNVKASWTDPSERWELAVFATNVLDKKYNAQVLPGLPAVQRTYGEPVSVGVSAAFKY